MGCRQLTLRKSQLIHGDQHHFPVYQPDHEALRQKYLEAEREARQHHYDSTKEGELLRQPAKADISA